MSIVHMDNFSIYGGNLGLMLNGIYAEVGDNGGLGGGIALAADPDGVSPGNVLTLFGTYGGLSNYSRIRYVLPNNVDVCGMAARFWLNNLPASEDNKLCLFQFRDVGNGAMISITVDTTGRLRIRRFNFDGSILATTTSPVITANAWWHIECKFVIGTVGSVELRVEGVTVLTFNANYGPDQVSQVAIANDPTSTSFSDQFYVKDWVIWNNLGTYNTNFVGSVLVKTLVPNSDFALNWATTPAGRTGASILDNIPPNDGEYITAGFPSIPAAYQGDLTDLPANISSVKALQTFVRAAKADGGDGSLQVSMISGASTAAGANRPITTAFTYWRDVFETDPATSLPWLPGAVNSARIKIDRTT